LLRTLTGDLPQEEFSQLWQQVELDMKVDKFKNPAIFWLRSATYCLINMAISGKGY